MPNTDEQNLLQLMEIRDNLISLIGSITAKPKPTYDIDGQKVEWTEYLDMLRKQLASITAQISDLEGPYEIETQGYL